MGIFVQIGATRDGSDPYLRVAHDRAMEAVLIETPDYAHLRQALGRQEFDQTLTVDYPSDVYQVTNALRRLPEPPALILAGFERYIYSAYAAARLWKISPYFRGDAFTPLNKAEQRAAISRSGASILQPRYRALTQCNVSPHDFENFHYPLVVKPVDGGGGLGVFLASNFEGIHAAFSALESITNYDGGVFQGFSIEEYVPGDEYSVQGLVQEGRCIILTFCKKFVTIEPIAGKQFLYGFREVGHIATRGDHVDTTMKHFSQTCVDVFKYHNGPFHIDMVQSSRGYYHLEMGFRLSGFGLVRLVQRVSGYDWAEEAFASHLEKSSLRPMLTSESPYVGQFTAVFQTEIDNARRLQRQGYPIEIQIFNNPELRIASYRLKSDITRHAGTLGRITVHAPTFGEVEHLLQKCSHERNRTKGGSEAISSAFSTADSMAERFT